MKVNGNMKTAYIDELEFGQTFYYVDEDYEPVYAMKIDDQGNDEWNAVDLTTGSLFGVDCDKQLIIIDGTFTFG